MRVVRSIMKVTDTLKEFRAMSPAEMSKRSEELLEELFRLRTQKVTGQMTQPTRLKQVRRDIARLKTLMAEKRQ